MHIEVQRIYENHDHLEGTRILVDRLWPRGISKVEARLDSWWKELAPSTELRKWFHQKDDNWSDFKVRYFTELDSKKSLIAEKLKDLDLRKTLILLYGAKDTDHNQAVLLKEYLEDNF
ncbi:MAG TPA: DUF488 family protein [Membranihabitans sp.]|nr:DUF488 family protein [Membranihabitans sp.]